MCVWEHLCLRRPRLLFFSFLCFKSRSGRDESLKILRGSIPDYCPRVHVYEKKAEWWQPAKWKDVRCSDGGRLVLVEAKKRCRYSSRVPLARMLQYYYFNKKQTKNLRLWIRLWCLHLRHWACLIIHIAMVIIIFFCSLWFLIIIIREQKLVIFI